MIIRILASLILLFSVLFMPLWLSIILGILGMIYFKKYYEAVLIFFISDFLYGTLDTKYAFLTFTSGIFAFLILLIIEYFKRKFKFYPRNI